MKAYCLSGLDVPFFGKGGIPTTRLYQNLGSNRCLSSRWRSRVKAVDSNSVDWNATHDALTSVIVKSQGDEALQNLSANLLNSWAFLNHLTLPTLHGIAKTHHLTSGNQQAYVDNFDYDEFLQSLSDALETTPTKQNVFPQQYLTDPSFLESARSFTSEITSAVTDKISSLPWHGVNLTTRDRAAFLGNLVLTADQGEGRWKQIGFMLSFLSGLVILANKSSTPAKQQVEASSEETELMRLMTVYSPEALDSYWGRRWTEVAKRQTEIGTKLTTFLAKVFVDIHTGQLETTLSLRAKELRLVVQELGPAFIKVFQALATRGDVFPAECTKEFTLLQDRVEMFPTDLALEEIESSLGVPWSSVFQWISKEPLAAASLGQVELLSCRSSFTVLDIQVYHGLLVEEYGAKEVAVKVQRPNVFRSACLDVYILRRLVTVMTFVPNMSQEWKHLLDGWAVGFFDELDYVKEAHHMMLFRKNLKDLKDVKIPRVFVEFSSRKVLTTEWIFGEKFTDARFVDSRETCRTLLNCYLTQLLNAGYLHADPHPGNLICTNEGKLCLLDFGLVAQVSDDQKYALIEFITHLWVEDWDAVARDLEQLGFLPADSYTESKSELTSVLKKIFGGMVHGDGLRVNTITRELDLAAREHQIVIPSYFTLILRAFCIVEGLCIESTGGFSIVQECAPYIARRLLEDDNERLHALLRSILYTEDERLDLSRVRRVLFAAGSFNDGKASEYESDHSNSEVEKKSQMLDDTLTEAIKLVLSTKGTLAQKILINEMVSIVDGATIGGLLEAFRLVLSSILSRLLMVDKDWNELPGTDPVYGILMKMSSDEPKLKVTEADRQTLKNLKATLDAVTPTVFKQETIEIILSVATKLSPLLPELVPGLLSLVALFVKELTRRKAQRLADALTA